MRERGPVVHRHHLLALDQLRVAHAHRRIGQVNLRVRVPLLCVLLDYVNRALPSAALALVKICKIPSPLLTSPQIIILLPIRLLFYFPSDW